MRRRHEIQLDRPPRSDVEWRLSKSDKQFLKSCNICPK